MLESFLVKNDIVYQKDIYLKHKTWIKQGGKAKFWITPKNISELSKLVVFLYEKSYHFDIIGHTSNIYFKNSYNTDVVISTTDLKHIAIKEDYIECDCGVSVSRLSREMVKLGIKGFSGLVNLPGTVASAVHNNASCFKCSISERLISIDMIIKNKNGISECTLNPNDLEFAHRSSILKENRLEGVILSVKLKKEEGCISEEETKAQNATKIRKATQEVPTLNLGSVYSSLVYKKNFRNIISLIAKKTFSLLCNSAKGMLYYKKLQLFLYGYMYLDDYISNKNINTFIWRDDNSEDMFKAYQEFISKVYKSPKLEIEIKE